MKQETRDRLATGTVGAALVGAGATYRHRGITAATEAVGRPAPKVRLRPTKRHLTLTDLQLVRARGPKAVRARSLYGAGLLLGTAGTPALASALHRDRDVEKKQGLLEAGLEGTARAYKDSQEHRRQAKTEGTPKKAKALATAAGFGAAAGGAHLADRVFDRIDRQGRHLKPHPLRPAGKGVLGVLGATAVIPTVNHALRRVEPEYQVTPYGVKRKKTPIKPPSSKANVYEGRSSRGADPMAYRHQTVHKRTWTDDELDDMSADDMIDIKGVYHADTYAHYRPILAKRRAWYRRQGLHDHADNVHVAIADADARYKPRKVRKSDPGGSDLHVPAAIVLKKPRKRPVAKLDTLTHEQRKIANRKRRQATLSTASGVAGLTSLGLLATRHTPAATKVGIVGGGIGGINALYGAHATRREAAVLDRERLAKSLRVPYWPGQDDAMLSVHTVAHSLWRAS